MHDPLNVKKKKYIHIEYLRIWFPVLLYRCFSVTNVTLIFFFRTLHVTLTEDERKKIGRNSKALLNYGRQVYLENQGYKCSQFEYVTEQTSPENICILANRVTQDATSWSLLHAAWICKYKGTYVPLFNAKCVALISFIFVLQFCSKYSVHIHKKNFIPHNKQFKYFDTFQWCWKFYPPIPGFKSSFNCSV